MIHDARESAVPDVPEARPEAPPSGEREDHGPMVLIHVGAGHKGGVRPGDLVGAITGEARITSRQIGKIRVNAGYSLVEVPRRLADRVVTALRRTKIRGKSVDVRLQ
jgi:ATP-dependent RNA helicase DeaD